jgi:hypothetical protein
MKKTATNLIDAEILINFIQPDRRGRRAEGAIPHATARGAP